MKHTTVRRPAYLGWGYCLLALLTLGSVRPALAQTTPTWQSALALTVTDYSASTVGAMTTDASGNVYLVGSFLGGLALGGASLGSIGGGDAFVAKWSSATGSFAWAQRIAGSGQEDAMGVAVVGTSVYVTGSFESTTLYVGNASALTLTKAGGIRNTFVVKFTDTGSDATLRWAQQVKNDNTPTALAASAAGVYVTGYYAGTPVFDALQLPTSVYDEVFVAKLTDNGSSASWTWAQRAGGSRTDRARGLAVQGSSVYVAGYIGSPTATFGNTFTLTNANPTPDANGFYFTDLFVAKLVDNGASASWGWAQRAGNTNNEEALALAVSGAGVYVAGRLDQGAGAATNLGTGTLPYRGGNYDGFVAKFTDAGSSASLTWAQTLGGTSADEIHALAVSNAKVYAAGFTYPTTPVICGTLTVAPGPASGLLVRLADAGASSSYDQALRMGGGGYVGARALAAATGRLYVTGEYDSPATFGTTVLPYSFTARYGIAYLAQLGDAALATTAPRPASLRIYPNPAREQALVQVPELTNLPLTFTLRDALGRVVRQLAAVGPAAGAAVELPLTGLPAGAYLLQVQGNEAQLTQRLLLE